MNFTIHVHDSLDNLSAEWPTGSPAPVANPHYHVFQSRTFLEVWWSTFGQVGDIRACFVEVRDEANNPLIFIPLCITTRKGTKILGFIDADAADYNAPILFPRSPDWTYDTAVDLWEKIAAALPDFDVIMLDKMPARIGGLVNPLDLLADGPNDVFCHGNNLQRPWEEIDKAQPYRKTLLKKMRGLERLAPTQYIIATDKSEQAIIVDQLLKQKQRRFEETQVPGFDAEPEKYAFFHDGTEQFAKAGMLHLTALKVGDEIVATLWGLVQAKTYYAIMIGFEGDDWAKYSVGRIIYYRTLEWLHKNGFEYMDLGIGNEPWKLEHCDTTVPLSKMTSIISWKGRMFMRRLQMMEHLRSTGAWQKLRPLKWTVLRTLRQWRKKD